MKRIDRAASQTLRCLVTESGMNYSKLSLATVDVTVNSSHQSSTGYSTFVVNNGFQPVAPMESLVSNEAENLEAAENCVEGVRNLGEELDNA